MQDNGTAVALALKPIVGVGKLLQPESAAPTLKIPFSLCHSALVSGHLRDNLNVPAQETSGGPTWMQSKWKMQRQDFQQCQIASAWPS